ncbi:Nicotinamidase-related amidase [Dethiosulfatibacter aminovorans DSM 17477]|uniref:Nicotinamidase-related amidase n=1 Tax=Dethiosulfatibacter aminovorans DSM 17477 TaxID=1121476 RepID=A0A1M6AUB5_9FIRM|nr:hydrolase [Dethiosulfatibacter aminovorans]SHI40050.1 Nicotinamidase-related amidase [Dethiosulfatibacter aminovorans DSM 17477]
MRILKENTGAIIIDLQERLVPHMHEKDELLKNTEILIKGLTALGIPYFVSEQYPKGIGHTVDNISEILGECEYLEKMSFSCCDEASIDGILNKMDKKWIIVAGVESHICVQQTVIDMLEKGCVPVLVEDCVSSRKENDKRIAVERMRQAGAIVTTYESILFELCRYAGNSTFKTISNLVK